MGTAKARMHTPNSIGYAIHRVQDAVKLKRTGPHLFRHTALTRLANFGASIYVIQAVARHANIQTTQKYLHQQQVVLSREAADLVDGAAMSPDLDILQRIETDPSLPLPEGMDRATFMDEIRNFLNSALFSFMSNKHGPELGNALATLATGARNAA